MEASARAQVAAGLCDRMISIIIPVYNEAGQITANVHKIRSILKCNNIRYEFIIVDDGSTDKSWEELTALSNSNSNNYNSNIRVIRLSRNFGKEAAICAGLDYCSGDACVVMDADLQHPPALIPEMVRLWHDEGYQVVDGVKTSHTRTGFFNKIGSPAFYRIMRRLSGLDLNNASDFKLLDARVVKAWRTMNENNTFFRGMTAWVGFKRTSLPFDVVRRTSGSSKWTFLRLCKLAVNAITSYSSVLLQIVTMMGVLFLILSLIIGIQTLYMKFAGRAVSGFTTIILLLLLIGSTLMISLGIIGMYIARIFNEVKSRPRYLISESRGIAGESSREA